MSFRIHSVDSLLGTPCKYWIEPSFFLQPQFQPAAAVAHLLTCATLVAISGYLSY